MAIGSFACLLMLLTMTEPVPVSVTSDTSTN